MDDKIEFSCVHCGAKYKVSADISGKQVICKNCGKKFIAPMPDNLPEMCRNISQKRELENSSNICDKDAPPQQPNEQHSEHKACPFCGEQILSIAKKCRYCGEFLDDKNKHSDRFVETEIKFNPEPYKKIEKTKKGNGGWIGLALIIIAGWFFGRYYIMYITGTALDFKNVDISYHSPVTEHEAKKLAEFYSYQAKDGISILLTRTDNSYQIRYPLKKGAEHIVDNILVYSSFRTTAERVSAEVFNGKKVELHLCNDWMWTKRMISGQSSTGATNEPNSIFLKQ